MPLLLVEGPYDRRIVDELITLAGLGAVQIQTAGGITSLRRSFHAFLRERSDVAALIDADADTVPDAQDWARKKLHLGEENPARLRVFSAVPSLEAWVLADPTSLPRTAELARRGPSKWPLADELPEPRRWAQQILGPKYRSHGLPDGFDLKRALGRSPSLRVFMTGMADFLAAPPSTLLQRPDDGLRRALVNLLRENSRGDAVMWETASGTYTTDDLIDALNDDTELGVYYASEVMAIAVDLLGRRARRTR